MNSSFEWFMCTAWVMDNTSCTTNGSDKYCFKCMYIYIHWHTRTGVCVPLFTMYSYYNQRKKRIIQIMYKKQENLTFVFTHFNRYILLRKLLINHERIETVVFHIYRYQKLLWVTCSMVNVIDNWIINILFSFVFLNSKYKPEKESTNW